MKPKHRLNIRYVADALLFAPLEKECRRVFVSPSVSFDFKETPGLRITAALRLPTLRNVFRKRKTSPKVQK